MPVNPSHFQWQVGEEVMIWSTRSQQMYKGIVESVGDTLKVLVHSNGKLYNYHLDGSAILPEGQTNQRVFSVRLMNEVLADEFQAVGGG